MDLKAAVPRSYHEQYLFYTVTTKYTLDLILPLRDLNFIVLAILSLLGLGVVLDNLSRVQKVAGFFVCFAIYSCLMIVPTGEYLMGMRFIVAGIFFLVLYSNILMLTFSEINDLIGRLVFVLTVLVILNFLISFGVADPLDRNFFGFEHANLLGSYVIFGFAIILFTGEAVPRIFAGGLSLLALATTSAGAFLLSAFFWIKSYKFNFFNIVAVMICLILGLFPIYWISLLFFPTFNDKIFYPFHFLTLGGLELIHDLALSRTEIQYLDPERASSFLWRIYAYFIFLDDYLSGDFFNLIIGGGFSHYLNVWSGIAPHNDFLLVLTDFGALGLLLLVSLLISLVRNLTRIGGLAIGVFFIIAIRLALENNIYSFYILTNIVILLAFAFALGTKHEIEDTGCFKYVP